MYEQVEKPKENKSRAVANTVTQKKSSGQQSFGFVDNRPEVKSQNKLGRYANNDGDQNILQMKAKIIIDATGLNVDRDGDLKHLDTDIPNMGNVYRHMSPKHSRLQVAESFFKNIHAGDEDFVKSQEKLIVLQNQLTGYEYYTEHLGKQFMGAAEENKKLTRGEYDSVLLAAKSNGKELSVGLINFELNALAENYMYTYLSKHASNSYEFVQAVKDGSQMTLDAMWIFQSMKSEISETAKKLEVSPDDVLNLMKQRVTPQMAQKAMSAVASAAESAFVHGDWIGPKNKDGTPNNRYFTKAKAHPVKRDRDAE